MDMREKAVTALKGGVSCAQAVVEAYGECYGLTTEETRKLAAGFGGGFAAGLTCGSVAGGCMVLGLEFASSDVTDGYSRDHTYLAVQEFLARFAKRNGSHQCAELLAANGMDTKTPEGRIKLRESGLCVKMVEDAVVLVESIIAEESECRES